MRQFLLAITSLAVASSLAAQDNLTNIPDPDPAAQMAALHVADGFEINLFAADPMIDPPIQMAWDERGRLFVATSASYPQPVAGQAANDKIFMLEDTDGDGEADRSVLFADSLLTPTGVLPGDGGVYVANSTEILHLQDTDGDGRADRRRVVLSGFGTDDTHHIIHRFLWGPDGLFYLNQSVYIYSHIETPWGVERLKQGGIWRFDPAARRLNVLARGMWNSWGFDFDRWGQSFATDGAGGEGVYFIFPHAAYAPAYGAARTLTGLNPQHPKYAGLALLSGRHFPDSLAGELVTSDFRANRVKRFALSEDGSGFSSEEQEDLIWTDHVAFRPVDLNVGPDGALYLADWYNPIIQHGEVDFRDPRRDHRHGRIWRITATGRPLVDPPNLHNASTEDLLAALRLPEDWTRRQAKRLLRERGAEDVEPALDARTARIDRNAPDAAHELTEMLWTYQAIGRMDADVLREAFGLEDHRARAAAVRVLGHFPDLLPDTDALLAALVEDEHPRVRREAVHVLGERGAAGAAMGTTTGAEAASAALRALDRPMDDFLEYALWYAIRQLEPHWMPRFEEDSTFFGGDIRRMVFALHAADAPEAAARLAGLYARGEIPDDRTASVLESLAERGNAEAMDALLDLAAQNDLRGENGAIAHLDALLTAAEDEDRRPAEPADRLQALLEREDPEIRARAARLAGAWGETTLRTALADLAEAPEEALQEAGLAGLAAFRDSSSFAALQAMAEDPDRPPALRLEAVRLLPSVDMERAAPVALAFLQDVHSVAQDLDSWPLFNAFLMQEGGRDALTDALRARGVPAAFAQEGLDRIRGRNRSYEPLRDAFRASGAVSAAPRVDPDLDGWALQRLHYDVKGKGNPARGEALYGRLQCGSCHVIGGAGGLAGPDLSAIGVTAPIDYLTESLLKPEQAVKDGYTLVRIVHTDGSIATGNLMGETEADVLVRDAAGQVERIPKSRIRTREIIPGSLMPAGLTASLDRDEFVDLVAFLSALGEEGPYRVPASADGSETVRRWRVWRPSDSVVEEVRRAGPAFAVTGEGVAWMPLHSTVAGHVPLAELPEAAGYSIAYFEVDVETSGPVAVVVEIPGGEAEGITEGTTQEIMEGIAEGVTEGVAEGVTEGVTAWVDGQPAALVGGRIEFAGEAGRRRITLAVDRTRRKEGVLRATLPGGENEAGISVAKEW